MVHIFILVLETPPRDLLSSNCSLLGLSPACSFKLFPIISTHQSHEPSGQGVTALLFRTNFGQWLKIWCLSSGFCCCDKTSWPKSAWEEGVYLIIQLVVPHPGKAGKNLWQVTWRQELMQWSWKRAAYRLASYSLLSLLSIAPRASCLRMALPTVSWALREQSVSKIHHRLVRTFSQLKFCLAKWLWLVSKLT